MAYGDGDFGGDFGGFGMGDILDRLATSTRRWGECSRRTRKRWFRIWRQQVFRCRRSNRLSNLQTRAAGSMALRQPSTTVLALPLVRRR